MTNGDGERNTVVLSGDAQALDLPFGARVVGTGAPETVRVAEGAAVRFSAGDGDAVTLPGSLADHGLSASGNTLIATGSAGTESRIALNGVVTLRFDDGAARARIELVEGRPTVTLGGEPVDDGFERGNVDLGAPDGGGTGTSEAPNSVFLGGAAQTVRVPFPASVVGTAAAETVRVPDGADVQFSANTGDRVELAGTLASHTVSSSGNQLVLADGETRATVGVNGEVTVAFADGSATAGIGFVDGTPRVTLGGEPVGDGFDPAAVALDPDDTGGFGDEPGTGDDPPGDDPPGDDDTDDGGDPGAVLPPPPAAGGPALVLDGTEASENIEGNRNLASDDAIATIAGNGGADRFVFDNDPSEVEIADFAPGDQLFFTDGLGPGDIGVGNGDPADGTVQVFAGEDIRVDLSGLDPARDGAISDVASLRAELGASAIAFGASRDATNTDPDATAPVEVSFTAETDGFFDGMRDALTETLDDAWNAWQTTLNVAEGADVEVELRETGASEIGNALAATQSIVSPDVPSVPAGDTFTGREVHLPGITAELRTGEDPNGDAPDIVMGVQESSFERLAFSRDENGTIPEGQFDGETVFTHELGHALGFDGSVNVAPERADGIASTFDQHIRVNDFTGGFEFDGPNVRAVNDGDPVSFGPSDPFHIGIDGDLMTGGIPPNDVRAISQLDLAILADAGVPVRDSALTTEDDPFALV